MRERSLRFCSWWTRDRVSQYGIITSCARYHRVESGVGARYDHSPLLVNEIEFVFETTSNEDS